ncbi:MAG: RNA polymerase sigma factor [Desulforhopalus sp.]|nr:RNA polymerase sigma factor [Desulforhopalus sp.]
MNLSDEEIVDGVLAGEKELYAVLVERYQRPVFNLMYRYSVNTETAADLTQEVFVRGYDRLRSFRSGENFFPWLYALAVNHANDWSRKRSRTRMKLAAYGQHLELHEKLTDQQTAFESKEAAELIDGALAELPVEVRELLIFRYRHERSIREAAEVFKISESAVKMRIKRGLDELQQRVQRAGLVA